MPASPVWLGTCWAIWQLCNWVGVLHLSDTPPKRKVEQKERGNGYFVAPYSLLKVERPVKCI